MSIQKSFLAQYEAEESKPKIIWHKCNSVAKFIEAVNTECVAGIEYDVVATSDNVPVLFHDKFITQELIGGQLSYLIKPIEVSQISFEQLRKMRPDIDSLRKACEAVVVGKTNFDKNFEFHLEIKPDNNDFTDVVMKVLQEFPIIYDKTIPRSFQQDVLKRIKEKFPRDVCLLLGDSGWPNDPDSFNTENTRTYFDRLPKDVREIEGIGNFRPEYVSVHYKMLTQGFINAMKKAEIQVDVYTLNDILGLKGMKVDRIVTDKPEEVSKKLAKQKATRAI
jgi:glycerophosphoryl diester phosphodiesterase